VSRKNVRREYIQDISSSMKYGCSGQELRTFWYLNNKLLSIVNLVYEIMY